MEKYRCIKVVEAEPKMFDEELAKRFPKSDNKIGDAGYRVIYEDGYESWSPKSVFEKGYVSLEMNYKERLVKEHFDLMNKIIKLDRALKNDEFIENIDAERLFLLKEQLKAMNLYDDILFHRLELEGISFTNVE